MALIHLDNKEGVFLLGRLAEDHEQVLLAPTGRTRQQQVAKKGMTTGVYGGGKTGRAIRPEETKVYCGCRQHSSPLQWWAERRRCEPSTLSSSPKQKGKQSC